VHNYDDDDGGHHRDEEDYYDDDNDKAMKGRATAIARTLRIFTNAPRALLSTLGSRAGRGRGGGGGGKGKGKSSSSCETDVDNATLMKIGVLGALFVFLVANLSMKHAKDTRRWEVMEASAEVGAAVQAEIQLTHSVKAAWSQPWNL
jgi:hypothetical protein